MTQEEYEAKVQSMPHELQKTFREALEMSLSKRIVNRFMSTVMQAYAQGQRTVQKVSHDGAYMRGAEDMLEALRTVDTLSYQEMQKYFPGDYTYDVAGFRKILQMNPGDILEIVDKYRDDQIHEKDEREKTAVQAMSDEIGIEKLCEWMAEQDYEIYCFMCQEAFDTDGGCPNQVSGSQWKCGGKEHWKAFLTKVMEGWKDETGS